MRVDEFIQANGCDMFISRPDERPRTSFIDKIADPAAAPDDEQKWNFIEGE